MVDGVMVEGVMVDGVMVEGVMVDGVMVDGPTHPVVQLQTPGEKNVSINNLSLDQVAEGKFADTVVNKVAQFRPVPIVLVATIVLSKYTWPLVLTVVVVMRETMAPELVPLTLVAA